MYTKPLEDIFCKLNWCPDNSQSWNVLSKSSKIGFYNDGVLTALKKKTQEVIKETTVINKQKYWHYNHPKSSAFFSNCKMTKKEFVKPYKHQTSVIEQIHDKENCKFMSCTIQSPCASGKSLLSLLLI